MEKLIGILLCLVLVFNMSGCGESSINVINDSPNDISAIHISAAEQYQWSENLLKKDTIQKADGGQGTINADISEIEIYDVRVVQANRNVYQCNTVKLVKGTKLRFYYEDGLMLDVLAPDSTSESIQGILMEGPGQEEDAEIQGIYTTVTFNNNSSERLRAIYITQTGWENWGKNRLDKGDILSAYGGWVDVGFNKPEKARTFKIRLVLPNDISYYYDDIRLEEGTDITIYEDYGMIMRVTDPDGKWVDIVGE